MSNKSNSKALETLIKENYFLPETFMIVKHIDEGINKYLKGIDRKKLNIEPLIHAIALHFMQYKGIIYTSNGFYYSHTITHNLGILKGLGVLFSNYTISTQRKSKKSILEKNSSIDFSRFFRDNTGYIFLSTNEFLREIYKELS